jgi:hypothetical protein
LILPEKDWRAAKPERIAEIPLHPPLPEIPEYDLLQGFLIANPLAQTPDPIGGSMMGSKNQLP